MLSLKQFLLKKNIASLAEWFAKNPDKDQMILMINNGTAACFIKEADGVRLEIALAYLDCVGTPRRETRIDERGVKWETIFTYYEKPQRGHSEPRQYALSSDKIWSYDQLEEVYSEAEQAYLKLVSKTFRPEFLFSYCENWKEEKK